MMTDEKLLFEKTGRSGLADGAARFDALAKELKTRQVAQIEGVPSTTYRPAAVSPDEVWAKNYMTQSIGPRLEMSRLASITLPAMPNISFVVSPPEVAPPAHDVVRLEATDLDVPQLDAPQPIGTQFGRPEPRRSWLGRLLRPKSKGME
jgi:hypothetical protein